MPPCRTGQAVIHPSVSAQRPRLMLELRDSMAGAACFLLLSGPSLATMPLDRLRASGLLTMGVNNSPATIRPRLWVSTDEPCRFLESIWLDPGIIKFVRGAMLDKPISRRLVKGEWEYGRRRVREGPAVVAFADNTAFSPARVLP